MPPCSAGHSPLTDGPILKQPCFDSCSGPLSSFPARLLNPHIPAPFLDHPHPQLTVGPSGGSAALLSQPPPTASALVLGPLPPFSPQPPFSHSFCQQSPPTSLSSEYNRSLSPGRPAAHGERQRSSNTKEQVKLSTGLEGSATEGREDTLWGRGG